MTGGNPRRHDGLPKREQGSTHQQMGDQIETRCDRRAGSKKPSHGWPRAYFFSTMSPLRLETIESSSPFSFSGTLNFSKVATR